MVAVHAFDGYGPLPASPRGGVRSHTFLAVCIMRVTAATSAMILYAFIMLTFFSLPREGWGGVTMAMSISVVVMPNGIDEQEEKDASANP